MAITLEQKLECLTEDEYDAIENLVDIILMNRKDKKSFSDGGESPPTFSPQSDTEVYATEAPAPAPAAKPRKDYRCEECKELEGE